MKLKEIMTRDFETVDEGASIQRAAETMRDLDVGILPVLRDGQLIGTVTDRDITVRGTANGASPDVTTVASVMSSGVIFGYEEDEAEQAAATMEAKQVRRLLVLDDEDRCVGIVSLGDLAVRTHDRMLGGEILEEVSQPAA
jgi:CBS domain-containing protein